MKSLFNPAFSLVVLLLLGSGAQAQEVLFRKMEKQAPMRSAGPLPRSSNAVPKSLSAPTISSFTPDSVETDGWVTIQGANFDPSTTVTFGGVAAKSVRLASSTTISAQVGQGASGAIAVTTDNGTASIAGFIYVHKNEEPLQAIANLTAPLMGQGINIIPTPTFMFTQVREANSFAFDAAVWGNALGTDSTLKKVVSNLLVPQISLFGLKADGVWRWSNKSSSLGLAVAFQLNCLLKKVSYYDTAQKDLTSFNPFVLHPRVGFTMNFFHKNFFLGGYMNMLSVVSENEQFEKFFNIEKTTFFYPNVNIGGIFDISKDGKQTLKVELDMVINNGETRILLNNQDKVMPFLKVAILSSL